MESMRDINRVMEREVAKGSCPLAFERMEFGSKPFQFIISEEMKQQFIGLQHCKCGMSWKKDIGYFERTGDMVFALERRKTGKKTKQCPVIRYR